jgi:hypothetical protein
MFLAQKNFAMGVRLYNVKKVLHVYWRIMVLCVSLLLHQILHAITMARLTMKVIHFPVLMVVTIALAIMAK